MDRIQEIDFIKFCKSNPSSIVYFFKKACDHIGFDIMKVESITACEQVWKKAFEIWAGSIRTGERI